MRLNKWTAPTWQAVLTCLSTEEKFFFFFLYAACCTHAQFFLINWWVDHKSFRQSGLHSWLNNGLCISSINKLDRVTSREGTTERVRELSEGWFYSPSGFYSSITQWQRKLRDSPFCAGDVFYSNYLVICSESLQSITSPFQLLLFHRMHVRLDELPSII